MVDYNIRMREENKLDHGDTVKRKNIPYTILGSSSHEQILNPKKQMLQLE